MNSKPFQGSGAGPQRVTVVSGWLDAQPMILAEDLAKSSPETVEIVTVGAEDSEFFVVTTLRHALANGAAHIIAVAPPATYPHHLRHLVFDAIASLASEGSAIVMNALVTVVDIAEFQRSMAIETDVVEALGNDSEDCDDRTVSEVIIDQLEAADIIVLRGSELHATQVIDQFRTLCFALNPSAPVETCLVCALDPLNLLARTHQVVPAGWREPAWLEVIDGRRAFVPMDHGVSIVSWHSRLPLDPALLHALIDNPIPGLVRARGFFWLASRTNLVGSIGIAGTASVVGSCGAWWAATPHDEWPADPEEQASIAATWDPVVGDRSNDLVFVGINLDEDELRSKLADCEVHDVDNVLANRRIFFDPFDDLDEVVAIDFPMIDDWGPPYPVKCN